MEFHTIELDDEIKRMHDLRKEYMYLILYGGSPKLDPCIPVLSPLCNFCKAPLDQAIAIDDQLWCGACYT